MSTEKTVRWLRSAWIAGMVAFLIISIVPLGRSPLPGVEMADKIAHFGVFLILALLPAATGVVRIRTVLVVLILLALVSEGLQAMVPFRSCEAADIAADLLGMLFGLALGAFLSSLRRRL
jgi:VanZ family protein